MIRRELHHVPRPYLDASATTAGNFYRLRALALHGASEDVRTAAAREYAGLKAEHETRQGEIDKIKQACGC
jgi:hypothetical protein